jgi:hypothetical protein
MLCAVVQQHSRQEPLHDGSTRHGHLPPSTESTAPFGCQGVAPGMVTLVCGGVRRQQPHRAAGESGRTPRFGLSQGSKGVGTSG